MGKRQRKAKTKPASKPAAARKKKARAVQSDDESDNGSAASGAGPTRVKEPTFGAQFTIFRVLLVAGAAVSFAAGEGNQAAILATAAAAGAVWSRCGRDGRDGTSYKASHFVDSRVHTVCLHA